MEKNKVILIVDDDEDILKLLILALEGVGFYVETFTSGKQAIVALVDQKKAENADLIILDRILPDMDGLDILRAVRKKFPSHCPVLFLTVLSAEKDMLKGLREGAVDYITKPFSLDLFIEKANHLTKK